MQPERLWDLRIAIPQVFILQGNNLVDLQIDVARPTNAPAIVGDSEQVASGGKAGQSKDFVVIFSPTGLSGIWSELNVFCPAGEA